MPNDEYIFLVWFAFLVIDKVGEITAPRRALRIAKHYVWFYEERLKLLKLTPEEEAEHRAKLAWYKMRVARALAEMANE